MGTTPVCSISAAGISKPLYAACVAYFQSGYASIYGADIFIAPDDRDTQFISMLGTAIDDVNSETVAAYNAYRPEFAQGVGLSTIVKINGISRHVPSFSTAPVLVVGVFGTVIENGIAKDENGVQWAMPASVTIPFAGQIAVTATCLVIGAVLAPAGIIDQIFTPVAGWQSIKNTDAATPGAPVENDALLRQRQALSTSLPSLDVLGGIQGALLALPGVARVKAYENSSGIIDANGLPAHSFAFVVDGGDSVAIANIISGKKPPGSGTFGTRTVQLLSVPAGIPVTIAYSPVHLVPITVDLHLRSLIGFTVDIQANVQSSISDWLKALKIGAKILLPRLYTPAQLNGGAGSEAFEIISIAIARDSFTPVVSDIALAFNEAAYCQPSYVSVTVTV